MRKDGGKMENGYQNYGQQEAYGQGMAEGNIPNDGEYGGNFFQDLDYGLCKRCRRRSIDRSENPDSVLCRDCREELIRLKIPPVFYIVGAAVILMAAFTFAVSAGGFRNFGSYNNANGTAEEGYVLTAMDNLLEILEENPDNKDTAVKLADIGMEYGYYDYAAYAIQEYLVGKEVSDFQYAKVNGYITKLEIYYDTYDLYEEIWEEAFGDISYADEAEISPEDIYSRMDEVSRELSEYIGKDGYDQALLYYYLGNVSAETEEMMEYYEKCIALDPYYYDAQASIAAYYRRQGELERARQQLEEIYAVNKESFEVLRVYATLELVEGNLKQGLDYALQAYELYPEGNYVIDTYIVALVANGKTEEAEELVREYEEEYVFDDDLYAFLNGEMTLKEYYIGD